MTASAVAQDAPPPRPASNYTSPYGGLWIDRIDAPRVLSYMADHHVMSEVEHQQLLDFDRQGYVILPGAVSEEVTDRVREDYERLWTLQSPIPRLAMQRAVMPVTPELRDKKHKLLDLYAFSPAAREAAFAPAVARFLTLIFTGEVLLFQSLSFERGTEQGMHQDPAYVVVNSPRQLAASWIALEDIEAGSGELEYYEGSHRLEDWHFGEGRKHWIPQTDGGEVHQRFAASLHSRSKARGLPHRRFLAKKGDALIWHADLVHGGSKVETPGTRRSLVCHYCPGRVAPNYFSASPTQAKTRAHRGNCHYASRHYDVASDAVTALLG